jgi:hypothetical protein
LATEQRDSQRVANEEQDYQKHNNFSCFSASQNREFASKGSVGLKYAILVSFPQFIVNQWLNLGLTFKALCEFSFCPAIRPLSQHDRASIAMRGRLYRNATKALSQRDKAFIAISEGKKGIEKGFLRQFRNVFHVFRSLN